MSKDVEILHALTREAFGEENVFWIDENDDVFAVSLSTTKSSPDFDLETKETHSFLLLPLKLEVLFEDAATQKLE